MPDQWDGKTIKVSGFAPSTTDDAIELFLESKSRSGGDTVHSMQRDKETNIVYVTFENAGVAERVIARHSLSLDGATLIVQKANGGERETVDSVPPAQDLWDGKTVKVSGFMPSTTDDAIELFLESKYRSGGDTVHSMQRDKDKKSVYVTFENAGVAERVIAMHNLNIDGATLTVQKATGLGRDSVVIQNAVQKMPQVQEVWDGKTIKVSGFIPSTTNDAIELLLESKSRSGGDTVHSMKRDKDNKSVYVTFENSGVAERVIARHNLSIDGATLIVQRATGLGRDSVASGNVIENAGRKITERVVVEDSPSVERGTLTGQKATGREPDSVSSGNVIQNAGRKITERADPMPRVSTGGPTLTVQKAPGRERDPVASGNVKGRGTVHSTCLYSEVCHRYFQTLKIPEDLVNNEFDICHCSQCHASRKEKDYYTRGEPAKRYGIPVGWCRIGLHTPVQATALKAFDTWHRAFHGTKEEYVKPILTVGQLLVPGDVTPDGKRIGEREGHFNDDNKPKGFNTKKVFLSPSIRYAGVDTYASPSRYVDEKSGKKYTSRVAFQVLVAPDSYHVGAETIGAKGVPVDPVISNRELEWSTERRGSIFIYGLLIRLE